MDRSKWEYKPFEDCIEKSKKTKQLMTSDYQPEGAYPIISQEASLISGYTDDSDYVNHFERPVVIFGDHTRVLKYVDFDFAVGADGVKILIPHTNLDAKFLLSFLTWYKIPNLGYSRHYKLLKEISVPVPPISDQQRIVAESDCLNEMIAVKQEQLKEFDKLVQSIFYDMFGEGYNTKFLGEFCEVGTGATPDRKKVAIYYGGNVNWVKTTEVHNCDIYETEERITDIALEQTNCKVYYPGAILMAMYGQGKTRGQVARLMTKAATNQACAAIIPDTRICDKDYLYIYLLLSYEKIRNMARGGNQANLNLSLVKMIPVPLPPLALQQQFAEKIQAIESQKELVKQCIAETQALLDYTMDKYFG